MATTEPSEWWQYFGAKGNITIVQYIYLFCSIFDFSNAAAESLISKVTALLDDHQRSHMTDDLLEIL